MLVSTFWLALVISAFHNAASQPDYYYNAPANAAAEPVAAAPEPAAYPEPSGGQYQYTDNYAAPVGNGQSYQAPNFDGTGILQCFHANGISGGCSAAGSTSNFACGGDPYCYCYMTASSSGSLTYYGGCDDGLTNCVGGTFSNPNYIGQCCSYTNCNASGSTSLAISATLIVLCLLFAWSYV